MTDTPDTLSHEEVENRIGTAMRLVHDLFDQLHTFFRIVREYLNECEADLDTLNSRYYLMPKRKGDPAGEYLLQISSRARGRIRSHRI
jgi:hypothetical protein